jgi:hypothetical protein
MDREGETEHRDRPKLGGRAARNTRARRAPAHDERQPLERIILQPLDDGHPCRVELTRGRGRFAPGDDVWLLDERNSDPGVIRRVRCRDQVSGLDPASGPVSKHEPGRWLLDEPQMRTRWAVGRLDFHGHEPSRTPIRLTHRGATVAR